jgi:hypothetical protein
MSTSGITSLVSGYVKGVTAVPPAANAGPEQVPEAPKSRATTVKEAHGGDPVALRKLRHEEQMAKQQQAVRSGASEPGKGSTVDQPA